MQIRIADVVRSQKYSLRAGIHRGIKLLERQLKNPKSKVVFTRKYVPYAPLLNSPRVKTTVFFAFL